MSDSSVEDDPLAHCQACGQHTHKKWDAGLKSGVLSAVVGTVWGMMKRQVPTILREPLGSASQGVQRHSPYPPELQTIQDDGLGFRGPSDTKGDDRVCSESSTRKLQHCNSKNVETCSSTPSVDVQLAKDAPASAYSPESPFSRDRSSPPVTTPTRLPLGKASRGGAVWPCTPSCNDQLSVDQSEAWPASFIELNRPRRSVRKSLSLRSLRGSLRGLRSSLQMTSPRDQQDHRFGNDFTIDPADVDHEDNESMEVGSPRYSPIRSSPVRHSSPIVIPLPHVYNQISQDFYGNVMDEVQKLNDATRGDPLRACQELDLERGPAPIERKALLEDNPHELRLTQLPRFKLDREVSTVSVTSSHYPGLDRNLLSPMPGQVFLLDELCDSPSPIRRANQASKTQLHVLPDYIVEAPAPLVDDTQEVMRGNQFPLSFDLQQEDMCEQERPGRNLDHIEQHMSEQVEETVGRVVHTSGDVEPGDVLIETTGTFAFSPHARLFRPRRDSGLGMLTHIYVNHSED